MSRDGDRKQFETHLKRIEDDIQLNSVLTTDKVINFAGISKRNQYRDGDDEKKSPQEIGLLGWRERWSRWNEKVLDETEERNGGTNG